MLLVEDRIKLRDELFDELILANIIYYSNNTSGIKRSKLTNYIFNNFEFKIKYNLYISNFRTEDEALWCLKRKDDISNHLCPVCKELAKFYNYKKGYRVLCHKEECCHKYYQSKEFQDKYIQTMLTRYNIDHPMRLQKFRDAYNATMQKLYGVNWVLESKVFQEIVKQTCRNRYGYDYAMKNIDILERFKQSMRNKYGHDYALQCSQFLAKLIENNKLKYGVDWYFQTEEFKKQSKKSKLDRYGDENYHNQEKINQTNREKLNVNWPFQSQIIQDKVKATNQKNLNVDYPFQSEIIQSKIIEKNFAKYNAKNPMQTSKIVELWRRSYYTNHPIISIIDVQSILNLFEENVQLIDIYSNNEYFVQFIQMLYFNKGSMLSINELVLIFDKSFSTIDKRVHELKLEEFFNIKDSALEVQFRDFLISNRFIEDKDFERHLFNLYINEESRQQIDFLFNACNIGFEINDVAGHNITRHDSMYHYNKTLMAKDQHNIRLIHLWEWELSEFYWAKTSQWILHILNQNKIQLNIFDGDNYDIKLVNKDEALKFLNQYSLNDNRDSDSYIGIYYKDELIEVLSFKNNILSIYIKFGYNIIKGTKEIIESYIKFKNLDHIITYIDLSKFTGNTITELGFKLLKYQEPDIISELSNESSKYKQLYNCGQNVYIFKGEMISSGTESAEWSF